MARKSSGLSPWRPTADDVEKILQDMRDADNGSLRSTPAIVLARRTIAKMGLDPKRLSHLRQTYAKWRSAGFPPILHPVPAELVAKIQADVARERSTIDGFVKRVLLAYRDAARLRLPECLSDRPVPGMRDERIHDLRRDIEMGFAKVADRIGPRGERAREAVRALGGNAEHRTRQLGKIMAELALLRRWREVLTILATERGLKSGAIAVQIDYDDSDKK